MTGLALLALTISSGMASSNIDSDPRAAHRWAPYDARADAAYAQTILTANAGTRRVEEARRAAIAAIRRDPSSVPAARTLGLALDLQGQGKDARRLLLYAEALSRRDLATELWLSQDAVARNDVGSALLHYSRALSTSAPSEAIIMPVLIAATADPQLTIPLADALARGTIWRDSFFANAINGAPDARMLAQLVKELARRGVVITDPPRAALIARLVDGHDYAAARELYRLTPADGGPGGRQANAVADGGFDVQPRFPPFDWALADTPDLHAELGRATSSRNNVLYFAGENGTGGEVAGQLLLLSPGAYRLSSRIGAIDSADAASMPRWQIRCGDATGPTLLDLPLKPTDHRLVGISGDFHVPPTGCASQRLSLIVPAGEADDPRPSSSFVDDVSVTPLG